MENSTSKQMGGGSLPKTPKQKQEKTTGEKDREKDEKARMHNKKMQERDLPRYKHKEAFVETTKAVYEIHSELGQGSFGAVYLVSRRSDHKQFAMKCESVNMKRSILPHEASVLLALGLLKSPHFVDMIDHGLVPNRFLFVVLKLVGLNLWDLRMRIPDRKYSMGTTVRIGEQTLAALRDMHRVGVLHRDIKPPNFACGREEDDTLHTIFVLDFGLCRKIAKKGQDLRQPRKECAFRGTTRYASMAAHDNKEQSRKDDLESWWYMICEMMVFDIPWKQCRGVDRDNVKKSKMKLREDETYFKFLFRKAGYEQMSAILFYLDKLEYTSIPDYDYIYHQLQNVAFVNSIAPKTPLDWDPKKEYRGPVYKENQNYIVKALE
ncbi:unnamed protein product [Caenorhabditis sp. 36 PRJEB53466]|nr:unnamed protein product [Caenorhabditis sp. 36 PRJEB53466]